MRAAFAALVAAAVLSFIAIPHLAVPDQPDFRAFYCAGEALRAHADPYTVEPARSCQARIARETGAAFFPGLVVAVATPPFGLLPFALLSFLPFAIASLLWNLLLYGSCGVAAIGINRLFGTNIVLAAAAIVACSLSAFANGQFEPIALALLVGVGALLRTGNARSAGAAASLELIKPQLGGALAVTLFAVERRARRPIVIALALFAALSIAAVGLPGIWRYLTVELPAHARSELHAPLVQYSLSTMLSLWGLPDSVALTIGGLTYAILTVLAAGFAWMVVRRGGDRAFVAFVPCALSLMMGTFVHAYYFSLALPLAFGLIAHFRRTGDREEVWRLWIATVGLVAIVLVQAFAEHALARPLGPDLAARLFIDASPTAPAAVVNADLQLARTPSHRTVVSLNTLHVLALLPFISLLLATMRLGAGPAHEWESP